jgi:hypothetical protein
MNEPSKLARIPVQYRVIFRTSTGEIFKEEIKTANSFWPLYAEAVLFCRAANQALKIEVREIEDPGVGTGVLTVHRPWRW